MKELMKKCPWLKVKFPFKRSHKQNQTLSLYLDLKKKIRIRKRYDTSKCQKKNDYWLMKRIRKDKIICFVVKSVKVESCRIVLIF